MNRAFSNLTIRSVDEEQRTIVGVATNATIDRVGDSIDPLGVSFPPEGVPLLWQHSHTSPVGRAKFDKPTKDGVTFTAKIPHVAEPGAFKDMTDLAWHSVKYSTIGSVSIGFKPKPGAFEPLANGGIRYREIDIYELSLVSVPALPDAKILEAKGLRNHGSGNRVVKLDRPLRGRSMTEKDWVKRIRDAKPGEVARVIEEHRKWVVEHGPISDAIICAKGADEMRRVNARADRQRGTRDVVRLTASERRLAAFASGTERYGR